MIIYNNMVSYFFDNHGYKYQNWVFDLCIIVMINFDTHHDTQRGFWCNFKFPPHSGPLYPHPLF